MASSLQRRLCVQAFRATDVVVMLLALTAASLLSARGIRPDSFAEVLAVRVSLANLLFVALFAVGWHLILRSHALYRSRRIGRKRSEWLTIAEATLVGTLVLAAAALVLDISLIDGHFLIVFVALVVPATVATRIGLRALLEGVRRRGQNLRRVAVVGCGPRGENLGRKIRAKPELGYLLVGYVDNIPAPAHPNRPGHERLLGSLDGLEAALDPLQLDEIWVGLPVKSHYESIVQVIRFGEERGVIVRMPADLFKLRLASSFTDDFEGQPILTIQMADPSSVARLAKRSLDVTLAGAALILMAPILALIALAVRLDTPGPVLFIQERVGWRRRRFQLLKFRTMVADAGACPISSRATRYKEPPSRCGTIPG